MPIGAVIGGVGALASAGVSIYGANKAADAQTTASQNAIGLAKDQMQQNQTNFQPWINSGQNSNQLVNFLTGAGTTASPGYNGNAGGQGALTTPFAPTMAQLEQTPGYKFVLGQGLKSTQNSYASKGLGSSGAAMKGAADYTTGLAGTTYQQQFQNYWNQNKSIYDMLTGQSAQGIQAAGGVTGANTSLTNSNMNATIGAGNAQAAFYNSIGPSIGGAFNGAAGAYNNAQAYNLLGGYLSNGTPNSPSYGPMSIGGAPLDGYTSGTSLPWTPSGMGGIGHA